MAADLEAAHRERFSAFPSWFRAEALTFTVAYLRDRAIRFRDLARQAEAHDEQAAQSEDLDLREGRPRPRRLN
jgi:tRNA isopentenyl-2-thiomethyl-A-37 hydroxylase MiaE